MVRKAKNGWYFMKLKAANGELREYMVLYKKGKIIRKQLAFPVNKSEKRYRDQAFEYHRKALHYNNLSIKNENKSQQAIEKADDIRIRQEGAEKRQQS